MLRTDQFVSTVKLAALCLLTAIVYAGPARAETPASDIIKATGVKGGLVVHIGCGEGKLTAALRTGESYLVHGVDTDAKNVAAARANILAAGLAGKVTISRFDGKRLPCIDNIAALVVSSKPGSASDAEIQRILAPGGVTYVKSGDKWTKTAKPVPDDIDEWTHYMHDASGNAVANDSQIGPPRHLQWQAGPRWSRHHDHMTSMSALVSGKGRIFYIFDEGSPVSPQLPSSWKLIARDAFSGVLLWKRNIAKWHTNLWPLKSGPASLPRRLVVSGDTVYVTLGIDAPVAALDAATGKTIGEFPKTAGTEEIIVSGGVLLALINRTPVDYKADLATDTEKGRSRDSRTTPSEQMSRIWAGIRSVRWSHGDRIVRAFAIADRKEMWSHTSKVIPLTLAANNGQAYFHDGDSIVAVKMSTGKVQWESKPVPVWKGLDGRGLQSWFAPTLVARDGKVFFAGGEKTHMSYMGWGSKDIGEDTMTALSAKTGATLWTADHPYSGYNSPEDLFVIDGKVWVGSTAKNQASGAYTGHNMTTGAKDKQFPPTLKTSWFHHRCYRAKATDKYILCSRNGIEFIDLKTGKWTINHWVRGGCLYGIMPCNGLIYAPFHPCACFPEAKLNGFTALAPMSKSRTAPKDIPASERLEKGPAFGKSITAKSQIDPWPTYRHDAARSGASLSKTPAKLHQAWKTKLSGKLSQPIAAEGNLFLADKDRHLIHAIDAASGKIRWTHTAGGRIDSPPTWDRGRLLFGSADGYVTCLRAGDGELVWRFRAAPVDRRLVAFDQLESAWPVHGSVLVQNGVASFMAGRSMYIDGGLRLCRLDAQTGKLIGEKIMNDRDPKTGDDMQKHIKGLNMPVALPDILSSDRERLFMRSQAMDLEGNRLTLGPGGSGHRHLFAPYGFTDDSWFHRTYWLVNDGFSGGIGGYGNGKQNPSGRILVSSDDSVFGYGRKPSYYRWSSVIDYQLFSAARANTRAAKRTTAPPAPKPVAKSGPAGGVFFKNSKTLNPGGKPITIAAWVKTSAKNGTVLARGAQAIGFALIITDSKPRMLVRVGGKTHQAVSSKTIGKNWTHIAGILRKNGRMEVYLDGEMTGSIEGAGLLTGDPQIAMKIGCDDTHQLLPKPLATLDGAIDEVVLFHRDLSGGEIQSVAKGAAKLDDKQRAGLVLHIDFAKGKARDKSGCGNNGQLDTKSGTTTQGPFGQAMVFKPGKRPAAAPRRGRRRSKSSVAFRWTRDCPIMVRAMTLAGKTLFIAGPQDLLDEDAAFKAFPDPSAQKQIADQQAALTGKRGAVMQAVNADTGEAMEEYKLNSPPVFDGMIAAGGRLYVVTMDGHVICYASK
ncbi:MAG: PQQ-binding-like beta-propeller repeat protein [Phycisphaerae bacterium]|jgi:outer membrane protein assembly factor BamB|nr:PQQ-binding-like beta-propeller repeat protein [Phycisphaerae bacterium]